MPFLWADTQRLEADDGAFFQYRRHMGINPVEVFDLTCLMLTHSPLNPALCISGWRTMVWGAPVSSSTEYPQMSPCSICQTVTPRR